MNRHLSLRSGNPALTKNTFKNISFSDENRMTLEGTVNKTIIALKQKDSEVDTSKFLTIEQHGQINEMTEAQARQLLEAELTEDKEKITNFYTDYTTDDKLLFSKLKHQLFK